MPYKLSEQKKAERLLLALEKKRKQLEPENQPDWFYDSFSEQRSFVEDDSKFKAAFCTRRAGKSMSATIALFKTAWENPGCNCVFIGLTRDSAKKIIWKDCFKVLNRRLKLDIKFNESALTATFPNGSIIYVLGIDDGEDEAEKLRGSKWKLVVIDEAQSYGIDLRQIINKILKPAIREVKGKIWMLGTPNNIISGIFYDVTNGKEPGWKVHRWSWRNNTATPEGETEQVCVRVARELEEEKAQHPGIEETTAWRQENDGEWVVDEEGKIYRFSREKNVVHALPEVRKGSWHKVLGIDFGSKDDTAFSLMAYHDHLREAYVIETFKKKGMDSQDIAEKIKELESRHEIEVKVGDHASQLVDGLNRRHGAGIINAKKTDKFDQIDLMNSELVRGRVKLLEDRSSVSTSYSGSLGSSSSTGSSSSGRLSIDNNDRRDATALMSEWSALVLDEKHLRVHRKRQELAKCPNHLSDATLYAWRYCYSYLSEPLEEPVELHSDQYWLQKEREEEEREQEQELRRLGITQDGLNDWEWID